MERKHCHRDRRLLMRGFSREYSRVVQNRLCATVLVGSRSADDRQLPACSRRPRGAGIDGIAIPTIAVNSIAQVFEEGDPLADEFTPMLLRAPCNHDVGAA